MDSRDLYIMCSRESNNRVWIERINYHKSRYLCEEKESPYTILVIDLESRFTLKQDKTD